MKLFAEAGMQGFVMRNFWVGVALSGAVVAGGCSRGADKAVTATSVAESAHDGTADGATAVAPQSVESKAGAVSGGYVGFDRNEYPGDDAMAGMKKTLAFTGYWLTNPPGDNSNNWAGKRELLKRQGWGFLILANGRLEKEILAAQKAGTAPADLGRKDAAIAVAAAKREGFPSRAILFLDQEEGGRLTSVQSAYLLAWTEAVAVSEFKPGVYASGERVPDGPGQMIDTIEDIRAQVKKGGMNRVAIFDAQDRCGPSAGCSVQPRPISEAGEPDLVAWQYSQSPRRPELTRSCVKTYAADGNCYAPGFPAVFLDLDLAASADPSSGR